MQDAATTHAGPSDRRERSASWRADLGLVMALFVLAYFVGSATLSSFLQAGGTQSFYQSEFSPAVAFACGRGYMRPELARAPGLLAFLNQQRPSYSCDELPPSVATAPLNAFQAISRYLLITVGTIWRLQGISWRALDVLLPVAYAIVAALAYGLLRLGFGPMLSLAGCLAFIFSPAHMENLPHLRDYAKAPFLLALLWLSGLLVTSRGVRATLVLAATSGVVLGVGLGFRNDLLVAIVPLVVTIVALCPVDPRWPVRGRLLALACFFSGFAVAGYPILKAYGHSSNTPHVAVLGLMTPFDAALGIEPSVYEFGHVYNDPYAAFLVRGVVERTRPVNRFDAGLPGYDAATMDYLGRIAFTFPADLAVRAYASTLRLFRTPFLGVNAFWTPMSGNHQGTTAALMWLPSMVYDAVGLRVALMRRAGWLVWLGLLAGFSAVLARTPRQGLWLLMCVAWFGGAGAVQFQARHLFYLEVMNIAALLAGISVIVWACRTVLRRPTADGEPAQPWWRPLLGPAVAGLLAVAAAGALLLTLRLVQTARVRTLLSAYQSAPAERVERSIVALTKGLVRVEIPPPPAGKWARAMSLLALDFGGPSCRARSVNARFKYTVDDAYYDYSRSVRVPVNANSITRVIMPVIDYPPRGLRFAGLELDPSAQACLADVKRIVDDSQLTVPLVAVLPAGWERQRLYQRLDWTR